MKSLRQILKETVMLIESSPIEDSLSDVLLDLRADGIRHPTTNEPITSDSLKNMARRIHHTHEYHKEIEAEERGEEHTPTDWSDLSGEHRRNYIAQLITGINLIKKHSLLEPGSDNSAFDDAAAEYISSVSTEPVEPDSATERTHRHALVGIMQELNSRPRFTSPHEDENAPGSAAQGSLEQTKKVLKGIETQWVNSRPYSIEFDNMVDQWMGPPRRGNI